MFEVREATEEDRVSASKVLWKAFEKTKRYEDLLKDDWLKLWHRPEKKDWAYVAVDESKVVGNLSFFVSNDNIIRGKPILFSGVWAVATDPAYRYKGVVREMFKAAFPRMRKEGAVLSILDPFYRPFYEKFGYALSEKRGKHILPNDSLRKVTPSPDIAVREVEFPDDVEAIIAVEKSMARYGSRFFHFRRTLEELASGKEKGLFYIMERNGEPVGTVWFWYEAKPDGQEMGVAVTRYTDESVLPTIIDLVKKHEINTKQTVWYADLDVKVNHFVKRIHKAQSFLLGSMMMRVIDFEGYCRSISIPDTADQPVAISLNDEYCPWNTGTYMITPNAGRLEIAKSQEEKEEISLDALSLSEVIGGLTSVESMQQMNEIQCSKETARNLDAIFPRDVFVSYQRF